MQRLGSGGLFVKWSVDVFIPKQETNSSFYSTSHNLNPNTTDAILVILAYRELTASISFEKNIFISNQHNWVCSFAWLLVRDTVEEYCNVSIMETYVAKVLIKQLDVSVYDFQYEEFVVVRFHGTAEIQTSISSGGTTMGGEKKQNKKQQKHIPVTHIEFK